MKHTKVQSGKHTPTQWIDTEGKIIACEEKIKVLNENMDEIYTICQDALEDAVLMGCDESYMRKSLKSLIDSLTTSFTGKK